MGHESAQDRTILAFLHRGAGNFLRVFVCGAGGVPAELVPLGRGRFQQRADGLDFCIPASAWFAARLCGGLAQGHGLAGQPSLGVGEIAVLTPVLRLRYEKTVEFEDQGRMVYSNKFVAQVLVAGYAVVRALVGTVELPHAELRKRIFGVLRTGVGKYPVFRRSVAARAGNSAVHAMDICRRSQFSSIHPAHRRVAHRATFRFGGALQF